MSSQREQKAKKRCQAPFPERCQPPFVASRRHFLRGVGVALALPWMESLPVFGQAAEVVKTNTPPLRLGIVFFSNGVEPTSGGPRAVAPTWSWGLQHCR